MSKIITHSRFKIQPSTYVVPWTLLFFFLLSIIACNLLSPKPIAIEPQHPTPKQTIGLDPGHGWKDSRGAEGNGLLERNVNLDIALHTRNILENHGFQVVMTRTGDDLEHGLEHAAKVINENNPDIVVSIHANSDLSDTGTGTEACYTVGKSTDEESKTLAQLLTTSIAIKLSLKNRGVFPENSDDRCARQEDTGWTHLYIHNMNPPTALIETAFVSNTYDADLLKNRSQDFAQAVADAIMSYFNADPLILAPQPSVPSIEVTIEATTVEPTVIPPVLKDQIAYFGYDENIWIISSNGTGQNQITNDASPIFYENGAPSIQVSYSDLTWAPNGLQLAFVRIEFIKTPYEIKTSLWVYDLGKDSLRQVFSEPDIEGISWKLDSSGLIFGREVKWNETYSNVVNPQGIWQVDLASGQVSELVPPKRGFPLLWPIFSSGGRYISFDEVFYLEGHGYFALYELDTGDYISWEERVGNYCWTLEDQILIFDNVVYAPWPGSRIWKRDIHQNDNVPLTPADPTKLFYWPECSPTGDKIAFLEDNEYSKNRLWVMNSDGSSAKLIITEFKASLDFDWSPNGNQIVMSSGYYKEEKINILNVENGDSRSITEGRFPKWQPTPQSISEIPETLQPPLVANTPIPNEGEIGQRAIWVSPSSTWEEMQNCLYSGSSSSECIPSIMENYSASQEAIEFSANFGGDFFLVDFEEVGRVDLGVIFYPGRANDNWQNVLLNGFPQLVSAENMFDIDITTSPGYQALSQQSSNPLLWSTDNNLYAIEPRPEGGQRFVFTYPIYNGCHACGIVSHALVAFDFDTEGRFLGSVLLSLDSSQP